MAGSRKPRVRFEWQGVQELRRTYEAVGAKLNDTDDDVKTVILNAAANPMVATARSVVPVKTGNLRDAIYATKGGTRQRGIFIGVKKRRAPYAGFVEFGTSKLAARPYFRPAFMKMASTYVADIAPGIKTLVETTAVKNAYHPT